MLVNEDSLENVVKLELQDNQEQLEALALLVQLARQVQLGLLANQDKVENVVNLVSVEEMEQQGDKENVVNLDNRDHQVLLV